VPWSKNNPIKEIGEEIGIWQSVKVVRNEDRRGELVYPKTINGQSCFPKDIEECEYTTITPLISYDTTKDVSQLQINLLNIHEMLSQNYAAFLNDENNKKDIKYIPTAQLNLLWFIINLLKSFTLKNMAKRPAQIEARN